MSLTCVRVRIRAHVVALSPENALRMRELGQSLGAHDLYDAAHNMVMEEFLEVASTNRFLELDEATLLELVSSDDLLVHSEKEVALSVGL